MTDSTGCPRRRIRQEDSKEVERMPNGRRRRYRRSIDSDVCGRAG